MQPRERSGFELSPHATDVTIHAWSSTVEGCLAEAARGYVACFAKVETAREPQRTVGFLCQPAPEQELLLELLGQVISLVRAQGVVPVRITTLRTPGGGVAGELGVIDPSTVDVFDAAPTAVARPGSRVEHEDGAWRCRAVVLR